MSKGHRCLSKFTQDRIDLNPKFDLDNKLRGINSNQRHTFKCLQAFNYVITNVYGLIKNFYFWS